MSRFHIAIVTVLVHVTAPRFYLHYFRPMGRSRVETHAGRLNFPATARYTLCDFGQMSGLLNAVASDDYLPGATAARRSPAAVEPEERTPGEKISQAYQC
jgi:hypothetical protein